MHQVHNTPLTFTHQRGTKQPRAVQDDLGKSQKQVVQQTTMTAEASMEAQTRSHTLTHINTYLHTSPESHATARTSTGPHMIRMPSRTPRVCVHARACPQH
jgi:hypothetical protein